MSGHTMTHPTNVIPLSTVDWIGRSATAIFFAGCPMSCPYCHNAHMIDPAPIDVQAMKDVITINTPFISAVVFSGGECFQQFDALCVLARFAHSKGHNVGVQTNGYYPDRIADMIDMGLVDQVCMDVKAPFADYERVCGIDAVDRVIQSLDVIGCAPIDVEVRTTVFPGFVGSPDEILSIATSIREIAGDIRYVIQQGLPENGAECVASRVFSRDELMELGKVALSELTDVRIKTKGFGEENVVMCTDES